MCKETVTRKISWKSSWKKTLAKFPNVQKNVEMKKLYLMDITLKPALQIFVIDWIHEKKYKAQYKNTKALLGKNKE